MPVYSAAGWIIGSSPSSCANNIYSHGNDKTEVQLYMSASCQPGSRVIQAFYDVENSFLFSTFAVKATKSKNKKGFSTSEKARISSRVNKSY